MLRKPIHAILILLLMTASVSAQMPTPGVHLNEDQGKRPRTKEQQQYDKELDRAYQSATKKIPEQNKPDPWGGIRTSPSAATKNKQQ
jgi:uncharacterized protein YecT (DUF1311 family)